MREYHDLSKLDWYVSGWAPHSWRMSQSIELGEALNSEITAVPARVPGSVQQALRDAGKLPDWNVGINFLDCEWVENRHWVYETTIPEGLVQPGRKYRLRCDGLDYKGSIVINGSIIGEFRDSFIPHIFDLTDYLNSGRNVLRIVFENSPRWLGTPGFSSKIRKWKPRFNYTWDWCARLMQIGIWDSIYIEETDGCEIAGFRCVTDADSSTSTGSVRIQGRVQVTDGQTIRATLSIAGSSVKDELISASQFTATGIAWSDIPVQLWWPNMLGDQTLYDLSCELIDADGVIQDKIDRKVGFREVVWTQNEDAPEGADPWICVVNGQPVFLQGINWTPILPNFADVTDFDYEKRIGLYKELGINIFRVWGGAFLEKEIFYNLCDEAGIMVWQEFPLSSSGLDNAPPTDSQSIERVAKFAESYIIRRQHHASLIIWCGGNELMDEKWIPLKDTHPMLGRLKHVVDENDPSRRFLSTSPSGPSFSADARNYGKGLHWDVHGPWKIDGDLQSWIAYWDEDDALFHSEMGCPGASPIEIIRRRAGDGDPLPVSLSNDLWRLPTSWWVEGDKFEAEVGHEPTSIDEYIEWSQKRQASALSIAVDRCRNRFPKCGGVILWMGHDCFPCLSNTSIVDMDGNPKPAAIALAKIFRKEPGK